MKSTSHSQNGLTQLQNWRQTHLGTTQNTGSAANLSAANGDGEVNLIESHPRLRHPGAALFTSKNHPMSKRSLSYPHSMKQIVLAASLFSISAAIGISQDAPKYEPDFTPQPSIPALSPEEELKTIQLPPGYSLELVLSERDGMREPVNITFDGNGRMYVAEFRSYMQDIDAKDQMTRTGVVSRHESTKRDGVFDKHTIFADKLYLPRMVLPLDDRVLINETDTNDIQSFRDTDGDGVADKVEMWFAGGPRGGNLEHQQSGLIWTLDNWIYQTVAPYRLRWNGDAQPPLQEKIPSGGGQWGLAQDDWGKIWWSNGGGEKGLWHFQTPIIYGAFDAPGQFPPDFMEVWPLVGLADFQSGPMRVRMPDKTLNHFSASCGQEVFRGDRLPEELRGNVFIGEPVGRLIRRAAVEIKDGITTIRNPHEKSEFIRSTDPNFRPVNMATGPDGCLYIVDMYRGVIQEGNWTKPGSYLRKVLEQYGMDKVVSKGRIWRLRHKDFTPGPQPRMLEESASQLTAHLAHPNGWWRDTAQKLLVLRRDKSVVPALAQMARENASSLGRTHALWTLEGLGALDPALIRAFLKDPNPQLRAQGIRVAETLIKAGDAALFPDVQGLAHEADPGVVLQVLMTGKYLSTADAKLWPDYPKFAQQTMLTSASAGVKTLGTVLLTGADKVGGQEFNPGEIAVLEKGQAIYQEVCFACHGFDGKGMPMDGLRPGTTLAPPLAGSATVRAHPSAGALVLLHGLAGPIGGKTYDAQMVPMNTNNDDWVAAVSSYVRNAFGNHGALTTAADVKRLRESHAQRKEPWTVETLRAALPPSISREGWKITTSENTESAALAVDGKADTRWQSAADQKPGQWVQIELPRETTLTGLRLDQWKAQGDWPKTYRLEVSLDGTKWARLDERSGLPGATENFFAPTSARFVKVTLTAAHRGKPWSVFEIDLFGAEPAGK